MKYFDILLITGATRDNYEAIIKFTCALNLTWLKDNVKKYQSVLCYFDTKGKVISSGDRPAAWNKLKMIENHIKDADTVIWIDADCIIKPTTQRSDLVFCDTEKFRLLEDPHGCNSGLIVMPGVTWAYKFLSDWWYGAMPDEINHPWWENKTIIRMMQDSRYKHRFGPLIPTDKVIHAAGIPASEKLAWLKQKYEMECNGR